MNEMISKRLSNIKKWYPDGFTYCYKAEDVEDLFIQIIKDIEKINRSSYIYGNAQEVQNKTIEEVIKILKEQ